MKRAILKGTELEVIEVPDNARLNVKSWPVPTSYQPERHVLSIKDGELLVQEKSWNHMGPIERMKNAILK